MFKNVSKYYLIAWTCFIVGVMCLMLNVLNDVFNIFFSVLFMAGLVLLAIKKIIDYNQFSKDLSLKKESMIIDMSLSSNGTFNMQDSNLSKKQLKGFANLKREKFTPILVIGILFLIMAILTYELIVRYF